MTSQIEMTDERKEKLEKAKSLGIKGAHLCSDETLDQKIAEEEAMKPMAEEPRKVAPRMRVDSIGVNERDKLLADLDAENPEFKHSYQPVGISQRKLDAKGLEATEITLGEEVVCRTTKESFLEWQAARNANQRKMMDAIDTEGQQIKSLEAAPKTGY